MQSTGSSFRRPAGPDPIHEELHFVLERLAGSMSMRLARVIAGQAEGISAAKLRALMASALPDVLESEFKRELLASEPESRKRRLLLTHVLVGVDAKEAGHLQGGALPRKALADSSRETLLTSEQASQLLHVSRTHMNSLLDSGVLGEVTRTEGGHRRVSKAAVLAYQARSRQRQTRGLLAVQVASERLGLYGDELAGVPSKAVKASKRKR